MFPRKAPSYMTDSEYTSGTYVYVCVPKHCSYFSVHPTDDYKYLNAQTTV